MTELCGIDLAWQSDRNPSAIAIGQIEGNSLTVTSIEPAVFGIENVLRHLQKNDIQGMAIDAPLIINNASGQRPCEKSIGKIYGSRGASCHTSNTTLYPRAKSVWLSQQLHNNGLNHLEGDRWQIECYPHPSLIEIFGLPERLKYKKGSVSDKRDGQRQLASFIKKLSESNTLTLRFDCAQMPLDPSYIDSLGGNALKSNEDALDSIICLYIAGLYAINCNGELFGSISGGYIWVPQQVCT